MLRPRQLKEYAVQLLYAFHMAGDESPEQVSGRFFELVLEPQREALYTPVAKWILAHSKSFQSKLDQIESQLETTLPMIKVHDQDESLVKVISQWKASATQYAQHLKRLERNKSASNPEAKQKLHDITEQTLTHAKQSRIYYRQVEAELNNLPLVRSNFIDFFSCFEHCDQSLEKVLWITNLNQTLDDKQFQSIKKKHDAIFATKQQVEELGFSVIAKKGELDAKILPLIENYTEERLDSIDYSILLLGAYELTATSTERSHVLNDLIEIAKKYTTQNSSKFVNGVLDKL